MLRLRGGVIEPSLRLLAQKYNCDKMICRKYVFFLLFNNQLCVSSLLQAKCNFHGVVLYELYGCVLSFIHKHEQKSCVRAVSGHLK